MWVFKTFNLRIYPNKQQIIKINKILGMVRYLHNSILNDLILTKSKSKKPIYYQEIKEHMLKLKNNSATFLNELEESTIDKTINNLLNTYKRFIKNENNLPKFKSKNQTRKTYFVKNTNENIKLLENKIYIKELGFLKYLKQRKPKGKIYNATIISEANKYYISLVSKEYKKTLPKNNKSIGIDLGIKSLITLSNGQKFNIRKSEIKNIEIKISKIDRKISRQITNNNKKNRPLNEAKNLQKQKTKRYHLHQKLNNIKKDDLHKISSMIVRTYQIICIEDLNIRGLIAEKKISKDIQRTSWGTFVKMLEYKSKWYGRELIKVSRWYPSTITCSRCRYQNKKINLDTRKWQCPNCQTLHDRDINASINILNEGLRIRKQ